MKRFTTLFTALITMGGCSTNQPEESTDSSSSIVMERISAAEERLFVIEPALSLLADEIVARGELSRANEIFGLSPSFTDLTSDKAPSTASDEFGVTTTTWEVGATGDSTDDQPGLFSPILSTFAEITSAEFGVEEATTIENDHLFVRSRLSLLGTNIIGHQFSVTGEMNIIWSPENTILEMEALWFEGKSLPRPMFIDITSSAASPELGLALTRSRHEEMIVQKFDDNPANWPREIIEFEAFDRHPGLAIGDVNGDGHDDIYITNRHTPNELLIWTDNGFENQAAQRGADIEGLSSSALIIDLDNDGDKEIVVGRTMRPSTILRNDGGEFTEWDIGVDMPRLVSSVIAADVNSDGHLDLFFSTYASSLIEQQREQLVRNGTLGEPILQGIVSQIVSQKLGELLNDEGFDFYLTRPGPPNVLIISDSEGGYGTSYDPTLASIWSNTYASAFSDYDSDGDQDLYLSNDFAENMLLQNDNGIFSDVTERVGLDGFGFGMGASFGDYNNDGQIDLYLSNMYSRAGRRITSAINNTDQRIVQGALGNKLYSNDGGQFTHQPANVERAGWSWGGQFGDVDNNGLADLYVPNGYYSAPEEVSIERDC